jgi:hypothetical protein
LRINFELRKNISAVSSFQTVSKGLSAAQGKRGKAGCFVVVIARFPECLFKGRKDMPVAEFRL